MHYQNKFTYSLFHILWNLTLGIVLPTVNYNQSRAVTSFISCQSIYTGVEVLWSTGIITYIVLRNLSHLRCHPVAQTEVPRHSWALTPSLPCSNLKMQWYKVGWLGEVTEEAGQVKARLNIFWDWNWWFEVFLSAFLFAFFFFFNCCFIHLQSYSSSFMWMSDINKRGHWASCNCKHAQPGKNRARQGIKEHKNCGYCSPRVGSTCTLAEAWGEAPWSSRRRATFWLS